MIKRQASIAIPIAESVAPETLQSMMALVNYSVNHGIEIVHIGVTERQLIDDSRNLLAETFLKTSTEWLFWMDSDMVFDPDALVKLFEVAEQKEAKMVTGIYYQRKGMNYPCLWSRGEATDEGSQTGMMTAKGKNNKYMGSFIFPHPNKKEPFQVHAAGFGCVLVHRSVFEVLPRPWFQFIKGVCSEDFYFFVNAQEMGFKLWAVPNFDLYHLGDRPKIGKKDFFANAAKKNIEIEGIKKA